MSKKFKFLAADNLLWKEKLNQHFPHIFITIKPTHDINWYEKFWEAYKEEYLRLPPNIKKLFSLVKEGDVANLEDILNLKDLDEEDINGISLLDWAKKKRSQDLLDCLYRKAIEKYKSGITIDTKAKDKYHRTILHWAILCHQPASTIEHLLLQDPDLLNASSEIGEAIHLACKEGHLDIVKLLIEKYPTLLNHGDRSGQTPVLWAASGGHSHIVSYLAEQGADLNQQSANNVGNDTGGYTPLHWAIRNGHIETAKLLITKKVRVDIPSNTGANMQAIHVACEEGHLDIVELLIKNQPALLNETDSYGQSPVLWAATRGHSPVVRHLAEQGADLNRQTI